VENLKAQIQKEMTDAFKAGDSLTKSTLSMLLASIQNKEIEKGKDTELSNDDIIAIIGTEVKKRKDAAQQYKDGGRPELAQKEKDEISVLEKYLPEQMSEEEVTTVISRVIEEMKAEGMGQMGQVMNEVMKELKGKADGSLVNRIVKEKLSS